MTVIAIDPGPEHSAYVVWDGAKIWSAGIEANSQMLSRLYNPPAMYLVIEEIASYGMPVGREVFQTVRWSGRFEEAWGLKNQFHYLPRLKVKQHLCHDSRAKDANIRQALVDRFGKPGTKKQPGTTYGLRKDIWSAFAVAVTWWDQNNVTHDSGALNRSKLAMV